MVTNTKRIAAWIIGILCSLLPLAGSNVQNDIVFRHLSISEGLSNNSVNCLCRDSRGFIWIGTAFGLNRYDSYSFQRYYDYNSGLPGNGIRNIFEDPEGDIWLDTHKGYCIYQYVTGKFSTDLPAKLRKYDIPCDSINHAGTDRTKKFLWCNDNEKLYLYNHATKVTKAFPLLSKYITSVCVTNEYVYTLYGNGDFYSIHINSSQTRAIDIPARYKERLNGAYPEAYTDNNGGIWVHTFLNSLLLYKKNVEEEWQEVILSDKVEPFNRIRSIAEDSNGNVWLITSHLGAFIYHPKSGTLTNLVHYPFQSHTIASNNLYALHIDQDGIVWIGNFKHGVSYYVPQSQVFLNYRFPDYNDILNFREDDSYLWYGTDGGGLMRYSRKEGVSEKIPLPANVIVTLKTDSKGRMWLGCYQNGLICYDHGRITQYTTANSELLENDVYGIQEDGRGYIWLSTLNGGMHRLNPASGEMQTVFARKDAINIRELLYMGNDTLYAATSLGLMRINTANCHYEFIRSNRTGTQPLEEMNLYAICRDTRNILWMGHTKGLTYWNLDTDSVCILDQNHGLPINMVKAIIEDNNRQMWVGTCNGIVRINLSQRPLSIVSYGVGDGMISDDVNERAMYKAKDGNILVGTPNGMISIVPQEIMRGDYNAKVCLTHIEAQKPPVYEHLNSKSPECATEVVLKEGMPFFQLRFSTLDFVEQGKIRYAYHIRGVNDGWIDMADNRIDFSIFPAGKYDLQVKACNAEGIWSADVKKLTIRILPPWWRTWWAYMLYTCCLLCAVLFIVRNLRTRHKQKQILQAIEVENEKQQKINNMKLQFFANISHELRTPLSLIINPLEEFFENHPEHRTGILDMVKQNADYLLELINQLLDFRKLDAKAETLKYRHDNILILLSEIFHSFDPMAQKRNISYSLTCPKDSVFMDFDYDKIRKVCTNILSNAFKFTPNKGSIALKIEVKGTELELSFSDTGCGIEEESKEKIFQRFYQVSKNRSSDGGKRHRPAHRFGVCEDARGKYLRQGQHALRFGLPDYPALAPEGGGGRRGGSRDGRRRRKQPDGTGRRPADDLGGRDICRRSCRLRSYTVCRRKAPSLHHPAGGRQLRLPQVPLRKPFQALPHTESHERPTSSGHLGAGGCGPGGERHHDARNGRTGTLHRHQERYPLLPYPHHPAHRQGKRGTSVGGPQRRCRRLHRQAFQ